MGQVSSVHDQWLDREIAWKAPHPDSDPERLAREARITARLEHPGIVPVYDAGVDIDDRPFYAMRLVRGRTLKQALADTSDEERLLLLRHFLLACDAVAYAHSEGVIHRDLKPANIMVGPFGETQVVDWGLAAEIGEAVSGRVVGTPAYMAPEASRGQPMDCRSDVYSLGRMLQRLLPDDPPPELVAIAERAAAEEPGDRYPTALELGQDVERWFAGRRVRAYSYTASEVLWRFVRARRLPIGVGLVAIAVVIGVTVMAAISVVRERDEAIAARTETHRALAAADQNLAALLVREARAALGEQRRAEAEVLAGHALRLSDSDEARGVLAAFDPSSRPRVVSREPGFPGCHRRVVSENGQYLACQSDTTLTVWDLDHEASLWSAEVSQVLRIGLSEATDSLVLGRATQVEVRDLQTGDIRRTQDRAVFQLGVVPIRADGQWAAIPVVGGVVAIDLANGATRVHTLCDSGPAATSWRHDALWVACLDGSIHQGDPDAELKPQKPFPVAQGVSAASWVADESYIGTVDGLLGRWTGPSGVPDWTMDLPGGWVRAIHVLDETVVANTVNGAFLVNRASGEILSRFPTNQFSTVRRVPGGVELIADERWRYALGSAMRPHRFRHDSGLSGAVLSHDGALLALNGGSGTVSVVRTADGGRVGDLRWQDRVVKAGAFTPDGGYIASAMGATGARRARLAPWTDEGPDSPRGDVYRRIGVFHDGVRVGLDYHGRLRLWRADEAEPIAVLGGFDGDMDLDPDRRTLLVSGPDGVRRVSPSGEVEPVHPENARSVSTAGETWAAATLDSATIHLGEHSFVIDPEPWILDVELSAGGLVALGLYDGSAEVWSVPEERRLAVLKGHEARVATVEFDGTGDWLVTASWDHTARLWHTAALGEPREALVDAIEEDWGLGLEEALALD